MSAQIPVFLALSADHDIDRSVALARRAEDAGVDAIVLQDGDGVVAEPTTVLSRIASVTERIGLIATFSAGYNDSLELARRLADLDFISGGRIGWRVGTGTADRRYFGAQPDLAELEPDRREAEVVESVVERWSLRTELRSAQGLPILVAHGDAGFAPGFADVVLTEAGSPEEARVLRAGIRSRAAALGRDPGTVLVLPEIVLAASSGAGELERWADSDGLLVRPDSPGAFLTDFAQRDRRRPHCQTLRARLGLVQRPAPIAAPGRVASLVGIR